MAEDQAPYYYWAPRTAAVRVLEGAGDVNDRMLQHVPEPPPTAFGLECDFDVFGFAAAVSELAGRELIVEELVKCIAALLKEHGWVDRGVYLTAVNLAKVLVEH